ncbi:MAG: elongation factor P [Thermodesulfobacteriota bacterium]|nr:elongation factor P [Thermodesulfobacteriota bacterium]
MYYTTASFRNGLKIEIDREPYTIIEFLHVKPGKGGAFVRTKIKNLINGKVLDKTFRSGEKVQKPDFIEKKMQFLYRTEKELHFMDTSTYDQTFLTEDQLGNGVKFLKENIEVVILYFKGKPIGMDLPRFVELIIKDTEPGLKGDTVSGGTKPAILETGAKIHVPLFINKDDIIKVDTREGEYVERVC